MTNQGGLLYGPELPGDDRGQELLSKQPRIEAESSQFVSTESLRRRLDWFNRLRWGAAASILVCVMVAGKILDYELPLRLLFMTVGVLAVLNLLYVLRNRKQKPDNFRAEIRLVKLQMLGDLVVLTVILNLTGGIENPFLYLYVIHVFIASLLFKGREVWHITFLAIGLFTTEVLLEYAGVLPHVPLGRAVTGEKELAYLVAVLASFWTIMAVSTLMGQTFMRHNRAIKDELVERQKELIEADRAKIDFFRFVTHEVKSPVNTAQSAVETALELGREQMSAPVQDMLQRGVKRLEQATGIVKDLADLTRGGMMRAENLRSVNLVEHVRRAVETQLELAAQRGIRFETDLPDRPVTLMANESMLDKVVVNLISNAVRYNKDNGMVFVTVTREGRGRTSQAVLSVADQGIGISPEDQEKIFEEFYRSSEAQKVSNLGTGLGLSIVRKFVESMKGEISLTSQLGEGSCFRVSLPLNAEAEEK
jgi:signal transduction histidine kinase